MSAPRTTPVRLAPLDLLRLGLGRLRSRPLRAVLSALGISIGIATMIVVTGIPASSQRAMLEQFAALGTNLLHAEATADRMDAANTPAFGAQAAAMTRRIGPVEQVSELANTHATARRSDRIDPGQTSGLTVLATRSDLLGTVNGSVHAGSFLTPATEKFPTAVLGSEAASRLGITELPANEPPPQIRVGDRPFTVVGVLNSVPLAPDVDRAVLVGWDAAAGTLHFDQRPTSIYLRASEPSIEAVRTVLPATVNPEQPGLVQVSRPSDALAAKRITQSTFSALFLGLASVALLVGGIGVANTMVISVLERRREIGLRRALGANRGQIRAQFLTESAVLCGLGGLAGTVLGALATAGYAAAHGWPAVLPVPTLVGGLAASAVIGILAGVYPATRASRLTPTEALATS
ncbi:ABC transporter permease [Amycolatopsis panacis]|uniref:ABC transporter permease n=1 Tax=Amycolatopsis panacis TaxID=2340917 RepID=A0A419IA53_9PSEU|nr:ABC transporter permease [Amycolatopsis panacis]RJQ89646.1 ABC transporter permease [Amycolatopsis panacis]